MQTSVKDVKELEFCEMYLLLGLFLLVYYSAVFSQNIFALVSEKGLCFQVEMLTINHSILDCYVDPPG